MTSVRYFRNKWFTKRKNAVLTAQEQEIS
jgi:hypothetical protein